MSVSLVAGGCPHSRLPLDLAVEAACTLLAVKRAVEPSEFAPELFG